MTNFVDLNNFKCEKCGSQDYRFTHEFNPENLCSPSTTKLKCLNCGDITYDVGILIKKEDTD